MITKNIRHAVISVTVTLQQLMEITECSERMTEYADKDGSLLITTVRSQQGESVRLILDRQCIHNSCRELKTGTLDSS